MAHFNLEKRDISRYQIQYPTNGNENKNLYALSDTQIEALCQKNVIENSDTVSITFTKAFSDTPTVVAGFIGSSNVNVYVESVTKEGCVIRTSAPVDLGEIAIHAIYLSS